MRISDWSSDVCSSDLTARLAPLGEQGATDFRSAVDIRSIGQVHPAHMRRPIIAVAKLLAGARAIVVFVEALPDQVGAEPWCRSEEHTSELQSLMRISYAVFCLKKKTKQ